MCAGSFSEVPKGYRPASSDTLINLIHILLYILLLLIFFLCRFHVSGVGFYVRLPFSFVLQPIL
jgi:hypothetical protein